MPLTEYVWAVVVGGIFCFALGFGMGANDVANNFGTSVGSKSISLKKAILLAAIFELVGSVALGATVTDSVRKGVYDPAVFGAMPDLLLMSNLSALISVTLWLLIATQLKLPVSATHSVVGGLVGCGLAVGWAAVNWNYIGQVIASWFIAPSLSVVVAMIYFSGLRWAILRRKSSVSLGFKFLWVLVFLICAVSCIFFMVENPMVLDTTPCEQLDGDGNLVSIAPCKVSKWVHAHMGMAMGIAIAGGVALTLLLCPFLYWSARRRLKEYDLKKAVDANGSASLANKETAVIPVSAQVAKTVPGSDSSFQSEEGSPKVDLPPVYENAASPNEKKSNSSTRASHSPEDGEAAAPGCKGRVKSMMKNAPWNADLHNDVYEKHRHAHHRADLSEKFDPRCEKFFTILQVVSASVMSLVHGCNDVSNAAAPYASVYSIYSEGHFSKNITVPIWVLVLGGVAICCGLALFGYRVIQKLGIEMFHVTPSRGFAVEIAAATVLIAGSFMGFPLSTTHVAVGAMIGVGLLDKHYDPSTGMEITEGRKFGLNVRAVSWKVIRNIFFGWVFTLVICALVSYLIFSFTIFSPTRITSRYLPCSEWESGACAV